MADLFFIFTNLANFWIWKIFDSSLVIGFVVTICAYLLYKSLFSFGYKHIRTFIALFILLLYFQYKTSQKDSLTELSNDQKRIQTERLQEYPPVYIRIFGKTRWIPIAHWFEERKEVIALYRIMNNFSEVVDPNYYYFANHPRERVGFKEFEKIPYIFLPLLIYGFYQVSKVRQKKLFTFSLFASFFLTSVVGGRNPLGPFSIYPILISTQAYGMFELQSKLRKLKGFYQKLIYILFGLFIVFIYLQSLINEII